MALYPPAIQRPIPPGSNDLGIVPVLVILHVRAGTGPTLYDYFNGPSGGVESHFYLRFDGTWEQYRDTEIDADANMAANAWTGPDGRRYGAISVETEGLVDGTWTPEQIREIKTFLLWCRDTHGIPLRVADNPKGPGVGYHILFMREWAGAPRACPGPNRIKQFITELVPWMASAPPPGGVDMSDPATMQLLQQILQQCADANNNAGEARRMIAVVLGAAAPATPAEGGLEDRLTSLQDALTSLQARAPQWDDTQAKANAAYVQSAQVLTELRAHTTPQPSQK